MSEEGDKYWLRLDDVPEAGTDPSEDKAGNGRWRDFSALLSTRTFTVDIHTIWPGQYREPYHRHTAQLDFFAILAGRGHMIIGQERYAVRAGDCLYFPPGISHALHNTSELPLSALVFATRDPSDAVEYPPLPASLQEPPKSSSLIVRIDEVREQNARPPNHPAGPRFVRPIGKALGVRGFEVDVQDVAPGAYNARYHQHASVEEFFFVLSGNVAVLDDGKEAPLERWCAYYAPPGRRHVIRNIGQRDARLLIFSDPQPRDELVTYYDPQGNEIGTSVPVPPV